MIPSGARAAREPRDFYGSLFAGPIPRGTPLELDQRGVATRKRKLHRGSGCDSARRDRERRRRMEKESATGTGMGAEAAS